MQCREELDQAILPSLRHPLHPLRAPCLIECEGPNRFQLLICRKGIEREYPAWQAPRDKYGRACGRMAGDVGLGRLTLGSNVAAIGGPLSEGLVICPSRVSNDSYLNLEVLTNAYDTHHELNDHTKRSRPRKRRDAVHKLLFFSLELLTHGLLRLLLPPQSHLIPLIFQAKDFPCHLKQLSPLLNSLLHLLSRFEVPHTPEVCLILLVLLRVEDVFKEDLETLHVEHKALFLVLVIHGYFCLFEDLLDGLHNATSEMKAI
ncbi:unnamed protein product [Darwinula stevensoni]|uniref:Uncharacterized protein n=1 Tax=Darwinula stevensoni TaxID=69355 RepID=A0A7R8XBH0_9CRUS|nr:unnamed protein product [Darwinula stevensoni]CAG0892850.1 unnamed protein product [Darwinula stevensoni]